MCLGDLTRDCRMGLARLRGNPYLVEQITAWVASFAEEHDVGVPWQSGAAHPHDRASEPQEFATQHPAG